jgi:hypothetical protein
MEKKARHSEATKKKISIGNKGRLKNVPKTDEHKKAISVGMRKYQQKVKDALNGKV